MSDDLYRQVFENNRRWVAERKGSDPRFFERLAAVQRPDFLYIGCADSRVPANEIMGLAPGEVFVHRNVANLVVNTDLNGQACIQYAVEHLDVKHIVVCGHYGCGGVAAAMRSADLGLLNNWLREVRDVYRLHAPELDAVADEGARYARLVELNVQEQCVNVIKTSWVQQSYRRRGFPEVHGWVYSLAEGLLQDLQIPMGDIVAEIRKFDHLDGHARAHDSASPQPPRPDSWGSARGAGGVPGLRHPNNRPGIWPMGRIFETRKSTMFARWDRMAKQFTRIAKDINIAVKAGGPNPDSNPQLRRVLQNARAVNMPKDKVEAAIKRASGQGSEDYEEVLYEGYGPHGVAILVETATDNPTRTVANVRMHFSKKGGNMGSTGSVGFMFDRMGVFRLNAEGIDRDELELDLIDHGLEDMGETEGEKGEQLLVIRCGFTDFGNLQKAIEERGLETVSSDSEYVPQNLVELPEDQANEVLELVDRLEQDDDVQKVFHNLA